VTVDGEICENGEKTKVGNGLPPPPRLAPVGRGGEGEGVAACVGEPPACASGECAGGDNVGEAASGRGGCTPAAPM